MSKRRNPVVRHANILRKGGAHQKSKTGQRHHQKQATHDEAECYFQQRRTNKGAEDDCPRKFFDSIPPLSTAKKIIAAAL